MEVPVEIMSRTVGTVIIYNWTTILLCTPRVDTCTSIANHANHRYKTSTVPVVGTARTSAEI